uniref:Uncharacterized protein n=1 Tax=Anguilla anguilla TaxID=7936 RepID=A0A0E9PFM3_ANGAN
MLYRKNKFTHSSYNYGANSLTHMVYVDDKQPLLSTLILYSI